MLQVYLDEAGGMIIPPETSFRLGLKPGMKLQVDEDADGFRLHQPVTHLSKVYIEPTNGCNLACRICIRNVWDEPIGQMAEATFARIIEGLQAFPRPLTISFGGFGEPFSHPNLIEMVAQAKELKATVEVVTNGTLLNEQRARELITAGLDMLWISLDGATPESYADVRLGAELPLVLKNISRFCDLRRPGHIPKPELGIVFVAMKRNIADLPDLLKLGRQLGATRFMVTNLLPHTSEMRDEILYARALGNNDFLPSSQIPSLLLPKMDTDELARRSLYQTVCGSWQMTFLGNSHVRMNDHCPFIKSGAIAIGWDGGVSPCLPLLHDSVEFLNGIKRFSRRWIIGDLHQQDLDDIWNAPEHADFRMKVQVFDYSPCAICDGCVSSVTNEEDCYGNTFPTCGGCLWAQGIIQCP